MAVLSFYLFMTTEFTRKNFLDLAKVTFIGATISACQENPILRSIATLRATPISVPKDTNTPTNEVDKERTSAPSIEKSIPITETPSSEKLYSFGNINFYNIALPSSEMSKENLAEFIKNSTEPVNISIITPASVIPILPFYPFSYQENIFEGPIFAVDNKTAVACLGENFLLVWLHSGNVSDKELAAGKLQKYLELDKLGFLTTVTKVENKTLSLKDLIAIFCQGENTNYAQIKGAVRVPPKEVNEEEKHVTDKLTFLAENYPESGFDNLINQENILLISFCGKNLAGEEEKTKTEKYTPPIFNPALLLDLNFCN